MHRKELLKIKINHPYLRLYSSMFMLKCNFHSHTVIFHILTVFGYPFPDIVMLIFLRVV